MTSTLLSRRLLLSSASSETGLNRTLSTAFTVVGLNQTLSTAFTVVLCAGIFYLVVLSIQQCILQRRLQVQPQQQTAEHINPERSAELCAIPVIVYGSSSGPSASGSSTREVDMSCSVCLADYEEGEEVKVLPRCGHMFHRECIDRWLIALSSFCPICRDRVIERRVEPADTRCNNGEIARWNNVGFGLSNGII